MWTKKIGLVILSGVIIFALSRPVIQGKPNQGKDKAQAPEIGRGVFVDYGYGSPPWYPPAEETDSYRWSPKLRWAASNLPLDVKVYSKDAPVGAFSAVSPGFEEWDGHTPASLYDNIEEDLTNNPPGAVYDGENTMSWRTIDGAGSIVAVCYYWYYVNTKEMAEFDIVFDIDEPWSTFGGSDAFDVQSIATHELGHTLVLQDLRSPRDGALTMHAYTWLGDTGKRTLGSGDTLGVQTIYGQ